MCKVIPEPSSPVHPLASWWASNHPSKPCANGPTLESFPEALVEPIAPSTHSSCPVPASSLSLRFSSRRLRVPPAKTFVACLLVRDLSPLSHSSTRKVQPAWLGSRLENVAETKPMATRQGFKPGTRRILLRAKSCFPPRRDGCPGYSCNTVIFSFLSFFNFTVSFLSI